MFELTLNNGETYKVEFQNAENVPFEIPTKDGTPGRLVNRDGIYAHAFLVEDSKTEDGKKEYNHCFSSFAALHPNPSKRSSRNVGRKAAFSRLLEYSGFSREIRSQFWNKYFEVRGKID